MLKSGQDGVPQTRVSKGVGDSSVVESVPRGVAVLKGCGFESHCSVPART